MSREHEELLDSLVKQLGFEHDFVIEMATLAEQGVSVEHLRELIWAYFSVELVDMEDF